MTRALVQDSGSGVAVGIGVSVGRGVSVGMDVLVGRGVSVAVGGGAVGGSTIVSVEDFQEKKYPCLMKVQGPPQLALSPHQQV